MKLVVFSNLWPPNFIGGYEIGASHVVSELRRRGHEVVVLSTHGYHLVRQNYYEYKAHNEDDKKDIVDVGMCVFGDFNKFRNDHPLAFRSGLIRSIFARQRYLKAIRKFHPDAFLVFNPVGVVTSVIDDLASCSRDLNAPVFAYVSDHWLHSWPNIHPLASLIRSYMTSGKWSDRFLGRVIRKSAEKAGLLPQQTPLIDHYLFCSRFIQELSRPKYVGIAGKSILHWGLPDIETIRPVPPDHFRRSNPLTLIYAGQILEHKGLPVIIRALRYCRVPHKLVVIGDDQGDYVDHCKNIAGKLGVLQQIQFTGTKPPSDMFAVLKNSGQVLVAPSLWDEPFSIVVLEGMGVGLPVVASATGGTPEAIREGNTGLLFERDHHRQLAQIIDRLNEDRDLCERLGRQARKQVFQRFTMAKMADQLEGIIDFSSSSSMKCRAA